MIPCFKTIYNNKITSEEQLLIRNLVGLLPEGIHLIDCPLTVWSDEAYEPDPRLDGLYDYERLGYYVAEEKRIVLLRSALDKASSELDIPTTGLRAVVFAHELGHYYTHQLPLWKTDEYRIALLQSTSIDVLEGWAQLFTAWAVKSSPDHSFIFYKLLDMQSSPYHVFKQYEGTIDRLLHSLDYLRGLSYPAKLNDWSSGIFE